MTKMMLREFTENGHKEYKALIEEIFESVQKADKDISIGYNDLLRSKIKKMQKKMYFGRFDLYV